MGLPNALSLRTCTTMKTMSNITVSMLLLCTAMLLCTVAISPVTADAGELADFVNGYGQLSTIAGAGLSGNGTDGATDNGWLPAMEGDFATLAELSRPHMTTADWQGNVYIADKVAHAIRKITPDGLIHTVAGTNIAGSGGDGLGTTVQLDSPNGLYTLGDGTTYILDFGNSMIRRLDTGGMVTTIVEDTTIVVDPITLEETVGIVDGRGLWVSPDETRIFYSSGTRVQTWTSDGGLETYDDGFNSLGNLDVDPMTGDLVVTDRKDSLVYRLTEDNTGEVTKTIIAGNLVEDSVGPAATDTYLDEVRGIAFTPEGGYLLATHKGHQVWYVDTSDDIHLLVDGANGGHGGDGSLLSALGDGEYLDEPRSVSLAPNGDLFITENDTGFVRYAPRLTPLLEPGDANGDLKIDAADLATLLANWGSGTQPNQGDFNHDGSVDRADLAVLMNSSPADAAVAVSSLQAVPEPSACVMALLALMGLLIKRRR